MSQIARPFIRHYRAPTRLTDGQPGTWYAEYDGIWTVREFVVCPDHRTAVAPFELTLRGPSHATEPPALAGISVVAWRDFESLWEQFAQARLHELAVVHPDRVEKVEDAETAICYFRMPFPAVLKRDEATSAIYTEYAQGVARRSFEVFADHTLVAPYEVGIPEDGTDEMLRAAYEGVAPDGAPIDPRLRPEEISHAAFETVWEQHALARLRALAESLSSTQNG